MCSHRALTSLQLWRHDGIAPMGWDWWNVVMQGHVLFRRTGSGKRSGGAALYVRQQSMYQALSWDG